MLVLSWIAQFYGYMFNLRWLFRTKELVHEKIQNLQTSTVAMLIYEYILLKETGLFYAV